MAACPRNQRDPRFSDAGLFVCLAKFEQGREFAAKLGPHFTSMLARVKEDGVDQSAQHAGGLGSLSAISSSATLRR